MVNAKIKKKAFLYVQLFMGIQKYTDYVEQLIDYILKKIQLLQIFAVVGLHGVITVFPDHARFLFCNLMWEMHKL